MLRTRAEKCKKLAANESDCETNNELIFRNLIFLTEIQDFRAADSSLILKPFLYRLRLPAKGPGIYSGEM